jgi:hypothetical protein
MALARRAADLRIFHFGNMRLVTEPDQLSGENKPCGIVGEFALHIQCAWRIETDRSIVTGRSDLWAPLGNPEEYADKDWDYDQDGNRQDQLIEEQVSRRDLQVEALEVHSHGSFTLDLSGGYRLVVFPCGTDGEDWRLFRPDLNEAH